MNIVEFLEARIDEDEVSATLRECHREDCGWIPDESGYSYPCDCGLPERMATEAKAKRAIVHYCTGRGIGRRAEVEVDMQFRAAHWIARQLAEVYKAHPDYQQEWAPLGND